MAGVYETIRQHVFSLEIIDTHEHLPAREQDRDASGDVLSEYMQHYFAADMVSAGLDPARVPMLSDARIPLDKRWQMIAPFWEAACNTGYGRALAISVAELYGITRIDATTIGQLNAAFLQARDKGGVYQRVLKDLCKIRVSLLDSILPNQAQPDRRFFVPVLRVDGLIAIHGVAELEGLAGRCGVGKIHSLSDLEDAAERLIDSSVASGIAALKSACAYERHLRFEKVTREAAEGEFNALWSQAAAVGATGGNLRLGDYMMHHVCRLADQRGLAFQIHTGLQAGNGNYIENANPALLTNLFLEYRGVRFDCFHIGYPYQQVLANLAKNFPNVFIDFCWAHIISPSAAVAALVEFLDAVPANKISGFGGDFTTIDGVYGHNVMARENIARALTIKAEQGALDVDRACRIGEMLLYGNPLAIFDLGRFIR